VSDEETVRDMVKELDLREAQIVYANAHARSSPTPQTWKPTANARRRGSDCSTYSPMAARRKNGS